MPSIFMQKGGGLVAKMTARQMRFCDEYLIDLNATQAAIRAGYSAKYANTNASKLLQITAIKEFLAKRMAEKTSDLIADQDEVLRYLTSVMRGESKACVLAREETGAERVIAKPPDEKERLKAAELLGKRYSIFTDKMDIDGALPVTIVDDLK